MLFDFREELDAIFNFNELVSSCVYGYIDCTSNLSGSPLLNITFKNYKQLSLGSISFLETSESFHRNGSLQFNPPDGKFRLSEYWFTFFKIG